MRTNKNYRYLLVAILAVVIYLFGVQLSRGFAAQSTTCPGFAFDDVHYATISNEVNQDGAIIVGEDLINIFWVMQPGFESSWYQSAPITARPLYTMRVYLSNNRRNPDNWIILIYGDTQDDNILYPAFWTFGRMFDEHNEHPLCWLKMDASEIVDTIQVAHYAK